MDTNFQLLKSFRLTVPRNHQHTAQLNSFRRENRGKFASFDENITDANFAATSRQLIPGGIYGVQLFGIINTTTSKPCLSFLSSQQAMLVSAQGLSVVWQENRQELPADMWTLSFDIQNALLVEGIYEGGMSDYVLPYICRRPNSNYGFHLGRFEGLWRKNCCLLCVSDLFV